MKLGTVLVLVAAACGDPSNEGDDVGESELTIVTPNAPGATIAYRDGDGAWTVVPRTEPLHVPISSGRYSVAVGCALQGAEDVDVYEMKLDEMPTLTHEGPCFPVATTMLSGTVSNIGTSTGYVHVGVATNIIHEPSFSFGIPDGTHDVVATRGTVLRDRLIFLRGLSVVANTSQPFDFEGPNAVAVQEVPISPFTDYNNALVTAGGTIVDLGIGSTGARVPPASAMQPGDLLMISIGGGGGLGSLESRVATRVIAHSPPATMSFPAVVPIPPDVSVRIAGTSAIVEATWGAQPTAVVYTLRVNAWTVHVSAARFAESTRVGNPDLSGVAGWPATLAVRPTVSQPWAFAAESGGSLGDLLRIIPVREIEIRYTGYSGNVRQ